MGDIKLKKGTGILFVMAVLFIRLRSLNRNIQM